MTITILENIIVSSRKRNAYLIDFNISFKEDEEPRSFTYAFRSPEVILILFICFIVTKLPFQIVDIENLRVTSASDYYSLGLSIVDSVLGNVPEAADGMSYNRFGLNSEFFREMRDATSPFLDLICRLLVCFSYIGTVVLLTFISSLSPKRNINMNKKSNIINFATKFPIVLT